MKKYFLSLILLTIFPSTAYASGGISTSTRNLNIIKGNKKNITVKMDNAAGVVKVSNTCSSIANVTSDIQDWLDNETGTISVSGINHGSCNINIKYDLSTYDEEESSGAITINVTVSNPTTTTKKSTTTTKKVTTTTSVVKSNNTNLKKVTINNNSALLNNGTYEIRVSKSTNSINIQAEVEDNKSAITGTGTKTLTKVQNEFYLEVTAEDGTKKTHKIIVTKEEKAYLNDLEYLLDKENNIVIDLKDNDLINKELLNKIKTSQKKVTLNKYDNNNLIYSLELNKDNINKLNEINPIIDFKNDNKKYFNYLDGLYLNINNLNGIKLTINTNIQDNNINVYCLDKDNNSKKLEHTVNNGFVTFTLNESNNYLISLGNICKQENNVSSNMYISLVIIIILSTLSILYIYLYLKKKYTKNTI